MYKGKTKFQTVSVDNKNGIEFFYICVEATSVRTTATTTTTTTTTPTTENNNNYNYHYHDYY